MESGPPELARTTTGLIGRLALAQLETLLAQFPAVALLGPRQVGKTTLALQLAAKRPSVYLDLEAPADRARLSDPALYLASQANKLVVLDEVQRLPELFGSLRGLIDAGRRSGQANGRFLLLGSASMELMRQSSESLAGRLAFLELGGLNLLELEPRHHEALWIRGGFPDSALAASDPASSLWREAFLRTYLERDIPQLGPRIPAETLRRFWTMLAHGQGSLFNAAALGRSLGVSGKTVSGYLDLLVDLLLVRRLQPLHANVGKRLVKAPKLYVRDSGLVHTLLGLDDREAVLGHPVAGASWEGFVLENLITCAPQRSQAWFYRTAAGAEIDLVLDLPGGHRWAIEVKRSTAPRLGKGFHQARADLEPQRCFVVHAGEERFPLHEGVEAVGAAELAAELRAL
ncbi:MAG: ATP-binding protein [Synechococcaceae bacterium WB8_1B_136]|nr:ATP-binding protein [Synechococcaceae bacterium WB8_1B_136]